MPLIKYYSFDGSNGTCYDGQREFAFSAEDQERFYPDEYLIAQILNKYLHSQSARIQTASKKIIVLTEDWLGNGGVRDGGKNTDSINKQILTAIEQAKQDQQTEQTLILVPFLYGYHHPGVAIDVKNKLVIYLDPFGTPASRYPETAALEKDIAEQAGLTFKHVNARQQRRRDDSSCGPILTASMIKFIEEFLKNGAITTDGFEVPRKNLATDRLFQMYVNNTQALQAGCALALDEVMLADERLWQSVFSEQALETDLTKEILALVSRQKTYVCALQGSSLDPSALEKVQLIRDFQSRLIELIFIQSEDRLAQMKTLLVEGQHALDATQPVALSLPARNLLAMPHRSSVYHLLRLEQFVSANSIFDHTETAYRIALASCPESQKARLEQAIIENRQLEQESALLAKRLARQRAEASEALAQSKRAQEKSLSGIFSQKRKTNTPITLQNAKPAVIPAQAGTQRSTMQNDISAIDSGLRRDDDIPPIPRETITEIEENVRVTASMMSYFDSFCTLSQEQDVITIVSLSRARSEHRRGKIGLLFLERLGPNNEHLCFSIGSPFGTTSEIKIFQINQSREDDRPIHLSAGLTSSFRCPKKYFDDLCATHLLTQNSIPAFTRSSSYQEPACHENYSFLKAIQLLKTFDIHYRPITEDPEFFPFLRLADKTIRWNPFARLIGSISPPSLLTRFQDAFLIFNGNPGLKNEIGLLDYIFPLPRLLTMIMVSNVPGGLKALIAPILLFTWLVKISLSAACTVAISPIIAIFHGAMKINHYRKQPTQDIKITPIKKADLLEDVADIDPQVDFDQPCTLSSFAKIHKHLSIQPIRYDSGERYHSSPYRTLSDNTWSGPHDDLAFGVFAVDEKSQQEQPCAILSFQLYQAGIESLVLQNQYHIADNIKQSPAKDEILSRLDLSSKKR